MNMKKYIKKSIIILSLLSLVLFNIPRVYAALANDVGIFEENSPSMLGKYSATEMSDKSTRFWLLLRDQFKQNTYPLPNLENKEIILLLGRTGVGKSTFINRMLEHEFGWEDALQEAKESENKPLIEKEKSLKEMLAESSDDEDDIEKILKITKQNKEARIATMGRDIYSSCTKIPQIYELPDNIVLVDCPGFGDSDGEEQEMLNLLMIRLFVQKAAKVNAVMAFFPYSVFGDGGKGSYLLDLARQLDYLFRFEQCVSNIIWCFTRCPGHIKQKNILQSIKKLETKKASFQQKLKEKFWNTSDQRRDMILLQKMLERKNRVVVASPFSKITKIRRIKELLKIMSKNSINKEYFDFYHPKIDIQGTIRSVFYTKINLINSYEQYHIIPEKIEKVEQDIKEYQATLRNPDKLKRYVEGKKKKVEDNIAQLRQRQGDLEKEEGEELVRDKPYRSQSINLTAKWLSDHKTIFYKDVPFDEYALEEVYDKNCLRKTSIKFAPSEGRYTAEFKVPGNWKNVIIGVGVPSVTSIAASGGTLTPLSLGVGLIGGAAGYLFTPQKKADVTVNFYAKRKYHTGQGNYLKSQQITQLEDDIREAEDNLGKLEKEPESHLKEQSETLLPKKIEDFIEKRQQLEKVLAEQSLFIYFIGEVYPCLYQVDDNLNRFAKKYKHTFGLFAKPAAADDDDEKKDDYHDIVKENVQDQFKTKVEEDTLLGDFGGFENITKEDEAINKQADTVEVNKEYKPINDQVADAIEANDIEQTIVQTNLKIDTNNNSMV